MKKILILTSDYLPKADANGICSSVLAKELISRGYKVTVFGYRGNGDKKKFDLDGVTVCTIKTPKYKSFVKSYSKNSKRKDNEFNKLLEKIIYKLRGLIYLPFYPINSFSFIFNYYLQVKRETNSNEFHSIITTYNPVESLIVGSIIKKQTPNSILIMYLLDTLTNKPETHSKFLPKNYINNKEEKLEKKLFRNADSIINMNYQKEYYKKKYPDNFSSKMYYRDIPLVIKPTSFDKESKKLHPDKVNFIYAGNFYDKLRQPNYLLNIFEKVKIENLCVNFYSNGCDGELKKHVENSPELFFNNGFINHERLLIETYSSDFLLSVGNKDTVMVPSKIFEYISTGKPIIHFYYNKNDSAIKYLKKYPLILLVHMVDSKIKDNIISIEQFIIKNTDKKVDFSIIQEIFKENTPAHTVDLLMNIFSEHKKT